MPYIGNTAADRFVASKAASVYSGDGSTTAFTLEHSVGADEDILVSVDGVIQEPSVAYAVSSGTTLTFTAAPSTNSGNNIFVYYLFKTVGTIDHPATSALSATSGTFTGALTQDGGAVFNEASASVDFRVESNGNANMLVVDGSADKVGIGVAAPSTTLHLDSGGTPTTIQIDSDTESSINFNDHGGSAQAFKIGTNISGNTGNLEIYDVTDSALVMSVDGTGAVTMPKQPCFLAKLSSDQNNIAVGTNVTVQFGTEITDQNADYNNSNYTFTAPVTGTYQFNFNVYLNNVDSASNYYYLQFQTSNRNYYSLTDPDFGQDAAYMTVGFSTMADMDVNDTAIVILYQASGTAQTDINANAYWSGCLLA